MADYSSSLLDFPARTAAVGTFLRDLRSRRLGDISALQAVVNESHLWATVYEFWRQKEWITPAPHSPMYVFPGPAFSDDLTVHDLCRDEREPEPEETSEGPGNPESE